MLSLPSCSTAAAIASDVTAGGFWAASSVDVKRVVLGASLVGSDVQAVNAFGKHSINTAKSVHRHKNALHLMSLFSVMITNFDLKTVYYSFTHG
jgi:hypothetical protein